MGRCCIFFFFNSKDISTQSLWKCGTSSFIKCLPLKVSRSGASSHLYDKLSCCSKVNCTRVLGFPPICDFFFFFLSQPALPFLCLPPPDHEPVAWPARSGWTPGSCRCYPVRHPRIYFMEDGFGHFRKLLVEDMIGTFIHLECFVLTPG